MHVYPERAGIPKLKGSCYFFSDFPETSSSPPRVSAAVTGMFHKRPNVTLHPRRTLLDSTGLPPGLYATNIRLYNEPHSSLGQDICAAPAHPRTIFLYDSSVHNNTSELIIYSAHRSLPTQVQYKSRLSS